MTDTKNAVGKLDGNEHFKGASFRRGIMNMKGPRNKANKIKRFEMTIKQARHMRQMMLYLKNTVAPLRWYRSTQSGTGGGLGVSECCRYLGSHGAVLSVVSEYEVYTDCAEVYGTSLNLDLCLVFLNIFCYMLLLYTIYYSLLD